MEGRARLAGAQTRNAKTQSDAYFDMPKLFFFFLPSFFFFPSIRAIKWIMCPECCAVPLSYFNRRSGSGALRGPIPSTLQTHIQRRRAQVFCKSNLEEKKPSFSEMEVMIVCSSCGWSPSERMICVFFFFFEPSLASTPA